MRSPATRTAVVLAIGLLTACGGKKAEEMRIAQGDRRAMARAAAEEIYDKAREYLVGGAPQQALELYREIQSRYPFTDYATQAELESIAAQYRAYQYEAAISGADRFIKQHPRHPRIDYVYYLRGMINYEQVGGDSLLGGDSIQRDPTHLRQAFTDFNVLIRNFPDSPYNKDAQLRMIEIKHRLAKHDLRIAEYYLRRRAWVAASRRAEIIIEKYQGSDSVPRALEIMEHSYRKLELEDLAQDTRAILRASYPNYILHREEFYRQRAGLEPNYELPPMDGPPALTAAQAEKKKQEQQQAANTAGL